MIVENKVKGSFIVKFFGGFQSIINNETNQELMVQINSSELYIATGDITIFSDDTNRVATITKTSDSYTNCICLPYPNQAYFSSEEAGYLNNSVRMLNEIKAIISENNSVMFYTPVVSNVLKSKLWFINKIISGLEMLPDNQMIVFDGNISYQWERVNVDESAIQLNLFNNVESNLVSSWGLYKRNGIYDSVTDTNYPFNDNNKIFICLNQIVQIDSTILKQSNFRINGDCRLITFTGSLFEPTMHTIPVPDTDLST